MIKLKINIDFGGISVSRNLISHRSNYAKNIAILGLYAGLVTHLFIIDSKFILVSFRQKSDLKVLQSDLYGILIAFLLELFI